LTFYKGWYMFPTWQSHPSCCIPQLCMTGVDTAKLFTSNPLYHLESTNTKHETRKFTWPQCGNQVRVSRYLYTKQDHIFTCVCVVIFWVPLKHIGLFDYGWRSLSDIRADILHSNYCLCRNLLTYYYQLKTFLGILFWKHSIVTLITWW
jgi:hypothetical protein